MKIIRDEEMYGTMMIPLLCDWGIKECAVAECRENPNTIIVAEDRQEFKGAKRFGLCEKHFQNCNKKGGGTLEIKRYQGYMD